MAYIYLAGAGICLMYYLIIMVYSGIHTDFSWVWVLGGVFLSGVGIILLMEKKTPDLIPRWIKYTYGIVFLVCFISFVFLCGKVISGMREKGAKNLDYVIVLGAHVNGEVPSKALLKRLEAACVYAERNPDTKLILSGGQGFGENITEASCMRRYLTERGITLDRLILEEKSTDTRENLKFSDEITGCREKRTGILSNNFHVYRAVCLAEKLGYCSPEGIAADSDPLMQPHYVVREVFAIVKETLKGNI